MSRKPFNTQIDAAIAAAYSERCKKNGELIRDVTEALFALYADGTIKLEKQMSYSLKNTKKEED